MNKSAILTYKGENSRKTNYPFGRYLQKNKQKKPQSHMIPNSALHFSEFAKILNSWPVSWNIVSLRERNMGSIIFFLCEIYHSQRLFQTLELFLPLCSHKGFQPNKNLEIYYTWCRLYYQMVFMGFSFCCCKFIHKSDQEKVDNDF